MFHLSFEQRRKKSNILIYVMLTSITRNQYGRTPLHLAAERGKVTALQACSLVMGAFSSVTYVSCFVSLAAPSCRGGPGRCARGGTSCRVHHSISVCVCARSLDTYVQDTSASAFSCRPSTHVSHVAVLRHSVGARRYTWPHGGDNPLR
jgi:hypothetical protein